jgi:hypothetical protein
MSRLFIGLLDMVISIKVLDFGAADKVERGVGWS